MRNKNYNIFEIFMNFIHLKYHQINHSYTSSKRMDKIYLTFIVKSMCIMTVWQCLLKTILLGYTCMGI